MALKIGFSPAALKDYTYIYIQKDIYIYILKMESGLQNPRNEHCTWEVKAKTIFAMCII